MDTDFSNHRAARMLQSAVVVALALTLNLACAAAHATDTRTPLPPGVAVIVNGEAVPQSMLEALLQSRLAQKEEPGAAPRAASADERRQALDDLISMTLLRQRAVSQGIDRQAATAADLEVQHKRLLADRLTLQFVRDARVSEDDLRAAYRELGTDARLVVSHVLVADEAGAREVISQLKRGMSFATLAKRLSMDPGSAQRGGSLGTMAASGLVPEFAQAAIALRPGEFTQQPVKTEFGWHVIRLTSKAPLPKPSFESVREQLLASLRVARVEAQLKAMREQADVKLLTPP
ncbi:MAG: hypothetical protein RLZZ618_459 [Pseudomonadota bacterium]|jgi:peptidyl-prolyl cis-trans isomerase C